ncbi:MAG: heparinase II/III family protein [Verrucomicrobia bacterium]|nr:heparinase II/III family protein [Verrucomicrobiota bacterium]
MKARATLLLLAALAGSAITIRAAEQASLRHEVPIPPAADILAKLRKEHPRLLATTPGFDYVRAQVKTEPNRRRWHQQLTERAQRILDQPPSKYEIPDGLRLLSTSRRVLDRVQTLALLYRLAGDKRFVERAWKELEAAANFPDWNPRHFLDAAEMTHAFAIGYDWLYEAWTAEQRATLRAAMIEKGLKPALASYRGTGSYGWWTKSHHNWNQVCNGGIGIGALAIGDEEPALAGEILEAALKSIQLAMAEFAPDGAWSEGPGYWNYATSYNVVFLGALERALGTDFGLSGLPSFADTGLFPIYITGPLGRTFNYADGSDGTIRAPQMFWLANTFERPAYMRYQRAIASAQPLDLLWYNPRLDPASAEPLPPDKYFRSAEVVTMRSAWDDRDALFVGFKAGDNKANHSNLDLGTFVLDALGVRWAVDLGADNYNLPGYFGGQRWTYYRMRAESHNTLVLNPAAEPDQDPKAAAKIARFDSKPDRAFAITDLTSAYAKHAKKVTRGLALLNRNGVLMQDEVEAEKPADVWWFLHTLAQVTVSDDGTTATLVQGEKKLSARLLSPAKAKFTVMDAQPLASSPKPDGQNKNEGVRKLAVHLEGVSDLRLAVVLTPVREGEVAASTRAEVKPLAEW